MEIGIVGLGRMGAGMARRLARGGAHVVSYDRAEAAQKALAEEKNVDGAENLAALCARTGDVGCARFHGFRAAALGDPGVLPTLAWLAAAGDPDAGAWATALQSRPP